MLGFLLGDLKPPQDAISSEPTRFDQTAFLPQGKTHGLGGEGMIFIPAGCRREPGCKVHVAFHGCRQNLSSQGEAFVRRSGYLRWADTNRLVVLFPQTSSDVPDNPNGCWDWWGYTGRSYLTRSAPQVGAVWSMLRALEKMPQ